jgi:hypothetical protein
MACTSSGYKKLGYQIYNNNIFIEISSKLFITYMIFNNFERISMFIINEIEKSHILISIRLYFTLTISITEDEQQPGKNEHLHVFKSHKAISIFHTLVG